MSRNTDYKFVATDPSDIIARLIAKYESITGHTLHPGDPDRLFIAWVSDVIVRERVNQNYIGNQNIPSRAEGANLDALGEWIYSLDRKGAQAAKCTVRFTISAAQSTSILIPSGTRVSDKSKQLVWHTIADELIPIGQTYADVIVQCETAGTVGNGYAAGQIDTLIDIDNIRYYSSCANITESDGGAEEWNDDTYFEMMRAVLDSYSTAGPEGSYIYWAKSVSNQIADVKVIRPRFVSKKLLEVYASDDGKRYAFIGGDQINIDSLTVRVEGEEGNLEPFTDYTVEYTDGLLKIALDANLGVATADKIEISVERDRPGHVYIYALMDDGAAPTETIKSDILDACNDDRVRPLTDYVSVHDPEIAEYDIDCTYYISREVQKSLVDIETAVNNAVNEYIAWQYARLGRDINPSKLQKMLMDAGVKRVEINTPIFTPLHDGTDGSAPQIARVRSITVTNGGFEDE